MRKLKYPMAFCREFAKIRKISKQSPRNIMLIFWYFMVSIAEILWFAYTEILYEPIFLGSATFLVFNRLQDIVAYINSNPRSDWGQVMIMEINAHPALYTIFFFTLVTWAMIKWVRYEKEKQRDERINTLLEAIAKKLGVDTEAL